MTCRKRDGKKKKKRNWKFLILGSEPISQNLQLATSMYSDGYIEWMQYFGKLQKMFSTNSAEIKMFEHSFPARQLIRVQIKSLNQKPRESYYHLEVLDDHSDSKFKMQGLQKKL